MSHAHVAFALIFPESVFFFGKFGPKSRSSPNSLKFDTGVHWYILISSLTLVFPNFLSFIFFWTNLVPKAEVLQIHWNLVQPYILKSFIFTTILTFITYSNHPDSQFIWKSSHPMMSQSCFFNYTEAMMCSGNATIFKDQIN